MAGEAAGREQERGDMGSVKFKTGEPPVNQTWARRWMQEIKLDQRRVPGRTLGHEEVGKRLGEMIFEELSK
jgi:hypothetical protein